MEKKRIVWIDMLRGFSILLIAYGHILVHCENLQGLKLYLYSFHVPIFFVISGLVSRIKADCSYKEFFIKKFKRVMIPYFVFAVLYLIPYIMLGEKVGQQLNISRI